MELVLGIDIGGTKVALGLAGRDGELVASSRHDAQVERGPEQMLARIVAESHRLVSESSGSLRAIGIACGGPLDRARGLVLSPPNLPGWDAVPVVARLSEALRAPACLENDANAAALGEHRFGAGRGHADLVYVTVSTGIGGGIVCGGRLLHGLRDSAGEVGHQTLDPDGPPCGCGNRGCLEALASGTAIARAARRGVASSPRAGATLLGLVGGDPQRLSARIVSEAAAAGDPLANAVWEHAMGFLGQGIANLATILAPEVIVIGGGVSAAGARLFDPVRAVVQRNARLVPTAALAIVPAALGQDSPLRGALALANELA